MTGSVTRGVFITFEGGEGAGKSTQARALVRWLESRGVRVCETREPGGSPGAEEIRKLLVSGAADRWDAVAEALLHNAARRDHVERLIRPALAGGTWVVCDRFADSTMAYQGYGHGVPAAALDALRQIAIGDLRPDMTFILDVTTEVGLARAVTEGLEDRYERMDIAFHRRLREGFLAIARADPARCVVLDAGTSANELEAAVRAAIADRFGIAP